MVPSPFSIERQEGLVCFFFFLFYLFFRTLEVSETEAEVPVDEGITSPPSLASAHSMATLVLTTISIICIFDLLV